jgi:hypothetical protein
MARDVLILAYSEPPEELGTEEPGNVLLAACQRCGKTNLVNAETKSAFFDNDRLVMVENIPTIICTACQEHHYSDNTVVLLDLLRGSGFPAGQAVRHIAVPVFSLGAVANKGVI